MSSYQQLLKKIQCHDMKSIEKIEMNDPQYLALKHLKKRTNASPPIICQLAVANALVCYQLSGTGEQYWEEFSVKMPPISSSSDVLNAMIDFLHHSTFNKRLVQTKIARLKRAENVLPHISHKTPMSEVWRLLGTTFGPQKKTTCFAVKMFGYAKRLVFNKFITFPDQIPIPVDSRIKRFTQRFCPCKKEKEVVEFWFSVAKATKLAPLHLDSLGWLGRVSFDNLKNR